MRRGLGSSQTLAGRHWSWRCCPHGDAPVLLASSPGRRGKRFPSWRGWSCTRSWCERSRRCRPCPVPTDAPSSRRSSRTTTGGMPPDGRRCNCSTCAAASFAVRRARPRSSSIAVSSRRRRVSSSEARCAVATSNSVGAWSPPDTSRPATTSSTSGSTKSKRSSKDTVQHSKSSPAVGSSIARRTSPRRSPCCGPVSRRSSRPTTLSGERIEGWSASPGRYEGLARVVHSPHSTEFAPRGDPRCLDDRRVVDAAVHGGGCHRRRTRWPALTRGDRRPRARGADGGQRPWIRRSARARGRDGPRRRRRHRRGDHGPRGCARADREATGNPFADARLPRRRIRRCRSSGRRVRTGSRLRAGACSQPALGRHHHDDERVRRWPHGRRSTHVGRRRTHRVSEQHAGPGAPASPRAADRTRTG